ncbi:MAG TPA: hypothetical protein P5531_13795 [Bacteroidales bacterium]|nr:hypothetical protein [Bacteroidales bacterium]HSA44665.1 hypothetical protein [Bacteroidales bacterium]
MKGKVSFFMGLLGFTVCFFLKVGEPRDTIFKVALGFVIGGFIELIVFVMENRKRWNLYITKIYKASKPVRVTVAYLFRIEVNGKYVLIKRHKKDMVGFQPVGGAFKYFREENRELFDKLGIEPCDHVPRDEDTEHDLRIRINKRKNLMEFLKWFESRKNRETDPWREFYEELIEPGLLPSEFFKHVKYVFIGKHTEGVIPSPAFPIDEFRYAEIYELRPETDNQKEAIARLIDKKGAIIFASPDEIRKGRTHTGEPILPHSFKILPK